VTLTGVARYTALVGSATVPAANGRAEFQIVLAKSLSVPFLSDSHTGNSVSASPSAVLALSPSHRQNGRFRANRPNALRPPRYPPTRAGSSLHQIRPFLTMLSSFLYNFMTAHPCDSPMVPVDLFRCAESNGVVGGRPL
jgi:hypothetical protein